MFLIESCNYIYFKISDLLFEKYWTFREKCKIELIATRKPVALTFILSFNFPEECEGKLWVLPLLELYASKSRSVVLVTNAELKIQQECSWWDIHRNDWLSGALEEHGNLPADSWVIAFVVRGQSKEECWNSERSLMWYSRPIKTRKTQSCLPVQYLRIYKAYIRQNHCSG